MYNLRLNDRWRHRLKEMSEYAFIVLVWFVFLNVSKPTITFWWEIFNNVNTNGDATSLLIHLFLSLDIKVHSWGN